MSWGIRGTGRVTASCDVDHDHVALCQGQDAYEAHGTLTETLADKFLDAAEVVWFRRLETAPAIEEPGRRRKRRQKKPTPSLAQESAIGKLEEALANHVGENGRTSS